MGLTAAMNIGRTGLVASQLGIQVAGNNIANVATPGYSRQTGLLTPIRGDQSAPGLNIGRGVLMRDVRRQVDEALLQRSWLANADEAAAGAYQGILSQIEATLGELGENDLSSEFGAFFQSWSERANQTQANTTVIQGGQRLADFMRRLRSDLTAQKRSLDAQLGSQVDRANALIQSIADMNRSVSQSEAGGSTANSLRDQRDQAITELSSLMDVTVVEQSGQGIDVLVGSMPVVLASQARPLEVRRETVDGRVQATVVIAANQQELDISSGQIGASLSGRGVVIDSVIDTLDSAAAQLAYEVNRLHSTGRNLAGLTGSTGTLAFALADRTVALNDAANQATNALPYSASNGGFTITVRDSTTGATQTVRIGVDLDGVDNAGQAGAGDDTSAEEIRAALDAIDGISATFTADGKLSIDAATGFDFAFSDDSSGALALLGVNSFFTGRDAATMEVRADLVGDPSRLTAGRVIDGQFVENGTALEISRLQDKQLTSLGDRTITASWRDTAQAIGVQTAGATTTLAAAMSVRESLDAQRAAVSGVNIDEESINLLNYQRMYQASARIISIADELTQTLLQLV